MIEVFKIIHNLYDIESSPKLLNARMYPSGQEIEGTL